ncbi:hypothetical protein IV500_06120 [Paeniglutamicibacter antarcticus]|uniref:Uncharacterized protein n=1 Tax=Arthrobacter terrae TaxID=2935737 RepID=A0A931CQ82_9MICC|nr:hypothetical protein [Arthrobacter terrae]MBG0738999.1 hypothetical protein [Arthrobacter terrae]
MTENASRQPKGIPVGGQFAATEHAETAISLIPRRPELEGWPESMPEPEVSFYVGDDNVLTTNVSVNGEPAFEVWNPGDDVHSTETSSFLLDGVDEETSGIAENWAKEKHQQIADAVRAEQHAAVERSRASILAAATGRAPQLSDDELGHLLGINQKAAYNSRRDGEYAATAIIARGVLKDHPEASHIELAIDSADNGDYVSGATVYNEHHEAIGSYGSDSDFLGDDGDNPGASIVEYFSSLDSEPESAWWAEYNLPHSTSDDRYTIDLRQAAAWTPGGEK